MISMVLCREEYRVSRESLSCCNAFKKVSVLERNTGTINTDHPNHTKIVLVAFGVSLLSPGALWAGDGFRILLNIDGPLSPTIVPNHVPMPVFRTPEEHPPLALCLPRTGASIRTIAVD